MPHRWNHGLHVVVLNGGTGRTSSPNQPVDVAVRLGEFCRRIRNDPAGARLFSVYGLQKRHWNEIQSSPEVLALAEKTPIACFTLGALIEQSVHVESGHLTKREVVLLRKKGAIGDILGRFINIDGEIADQTFNARTVGLEPALLRRKDFSICVAGGKVETPGGPRRPESRLFQRSDNR